MRVVEEAGAQLFLNIDIGGYGSRLAQELGRDDGYFINRGGVVVKRDDLAV
jgi:hypothetical protein